MFDKLKWVGYHSKPSLCALGYNAGLLFILCINCVIMDYKIVYTRDQLLDVNKTLPSCRLPWSTFHNIKQLGISTATPTRRGGCSKQEPLGLINSIPVRVTDRQGNSTSQRSAVNYNNLIHITPDITATPTISHPKHRYKFVTANVQSLRKKISAVLQLFCEEDIQFGVLTETWINDSDVDVFAKISTTGYKLSLVPRPDRRGGGIGLIHPLHWSVQLINEGGDLDFEYAVWKISIGSKELCVVGVYHPPYSAASPVTNTKFIQDLNELMERLLPTVSNILILGDMNIHLNNDTDSSTRLFQDTVESFGLEQGVNFSTHTSGNTLDVIISKCDQDLKVDDICCGSLISDHYIVQGCLSLDKPTLHRTKITFRRMKNIDHTALDNDLTNVVQTGLEIDDVTQLVQHYDTSLKSLLEKHAPLQSKVITQRHLVPWFDNDLLSLKQEMRRKERKWLKDKQENQWNDFKSSRNNYYKALENKKKDFISCEVLQIGHNSQKLFKLANNLLGKNVSNPMPPEQDCGLSESFANFFLEKIETIRSKLKDSPLFNPQPTMDIPQFQLRVLATEEISKMMLHLKPKTCDQDPFPSALLVQHKETMLPLFTKVVNASIAQATFPQDWKVASVQPLLKKPGLETVLSNYRPVSNLPYISKLTESAVLCLLDEHLKQHQLLPDYQNAYRKHYSCETALLNIHNNILWAMEHQKCLALCAIDLSAAFDTVDHQVLLLVLQKLYGVSESSLKWFDTYLRPRGFKVLVNGDYSSYQQTDFSVPQGSCLGPVLFTLYSSTLGQVANEHGVHLTAYADDHSFYQSYTAGNTQAEQGTMENLSECLQSVKVWMDCNRLKMNPTKTEAIVFCSPRQIEKVSTASLNVVQDEIPLQKSIKYLGVHLDQSLSLHTNITKKCQIASLNLNKIKKLRKFLTMDACRTIVQALVISHIDYGNSLYYGLPNTELSRLQRIQNYAAKIILCKSRYDSSRECLQTLHWLPVRSRIIFKIMCLVFKCLQGQAPQYLQDMLQFKSSE